MVLGVELRVSGPSLPADLLPWQRLHALISPGPTGTAHQSPEDCQLLQS